jgi:phytoene desaturase
VTPRRIVVIGAGLGGLASAALLARAGHDVTVLDCNEWIGGKSRRIDVAGQRIDTGPSLVTFPDAIAKILDRFDEIGPSSARKARDIAPLELQRLPEVGRYFFRGDVANLPVEAGHAWKPAWDRFEAEHGPLGHNITTMLTNDPWDSAIYPAAAGLFSHYGTRLNTERYLNGLDWMPENLREVISIHTLNAGVAPAKTLALFATMPAVMSTDGVWVPTGGVNEIPQMLARLATESGATIRLGERVTSVSRGRVVTDIAEYTPDIVVSGLDADVLERLLGRQPRKPTALSCSGIAVFAVLDEELPNDVVTHSVIMPDDPADLYESIRTTTLPKQTMAFLNYYRAGQIYPNTRPTAAILLTAPPDGKRYDIEHEWVQREMRRISEVMGLPRQLGDMITDHTVLHPEYFAGFGAVGGALYGEGHPWWQSGPFHSPAYTSPLRPWLWRVGASVHPGGGIPAVLGGALIAMNRLLAKLGT